MQAASRHVQHQTQVRHNAPKHELNTNTRITAACVLLLQ
jgi:hypothetical protein